MFDTKKTKFEGLKDKINFQEALELSQDFIQDILTSTPKDVLEVTKYLTYAKGRYIRTYLLFAACVDGFDMIPKEAIIISVSIELLHLSTLIHDDIIDDAKTRRGLATLQVKFGKKTSVLVGDYLLCVSLSNLKTIKYIFEYNIHKYFEYIDSLEKICLGEYRQHINNNNFDITYYEYIKIIVGKTATLFELAISSGAYLKNFKISKTSKIIEDKKLKKLGNVIGIIFQIIDDCKDYTSNQQDCKKTINNDLQKGVITLPIIILLKKNPNLKELLNKNLDQQDYFEKTFELLKKYECLEDCQKIIKRYQQKANNIIKSLEDPFRKKYFYEIFKIIF